MKVDVSIISQIDFHLLNLSESILILHLTRSGKVGHQDDADPPPPPSGDWADEGAPVMTEDADKNIVGVSCRVKNTLSACNTM